MPDKLLPVCRHRLRGLAAIVLLLISSSALAQDRLDTYKITVYDNEVALEEAIVTLTLPSHLQGEEYHLVGERGYQVPLQIDNEGRAWFKVNPASISGSETFRFARGPYQSDSSVEMTVQDGRVDAYVSDHHLFSYHVEETTPPDPDIGEIYERGGYIHPLLSPSNREITGDYPTDHPHHHGIWAAWTSTEFQDRTPDFWNMGGGTGRVNVAGLETSFSGPSVGGIRAHHEYVDLTSNEPIIVLEESWDLRVYHVEGSGEPYYLFDLILEQENVTDNPLHLPEYRYGGVGFRGNEAWLGEDNTYFLTSEGRDRSNGHATRARWAHISGEVDGGRTGVAILDHPDNLDSPQRMRIHPSEPFFNFVPIQAHAHTIHPGDLYTARYRYVVMDGAPNAELIDQLWFAYTNSPKAFLSVD